MQATGKGRYCASIAPIQVNKIGVSVKKSIGN